jgi:phosphate acetyltransferase
MSGSDPARVVFGDADDERTLVAVGELAETNLVRPVLVTGGDGVVAPRGVDTVSIAAPEWRQRCAEEFLSLRRHRGATDEDARVALDDPVMFAALYTRLGGADAGVSGNVSTSADVVRAGIVGVGRATPDALVCGAFLMTVDDSKLTFADCSVVPQPSADDLATIAITAADHHLALTQEPARVAMLSFSTSGSARHPDVDKVVSATAIARRRRPDLVIDGEMQFDVAFDPTVGSRKFPTSEVAGRANVFVFPDLDAGNVGYKVAERLGGARAIGSFVLGLQRPWVDLSRGCSARDIVDAALAVGRLVASG